MEDDYERNTGKVIAETFRDLKIDPKSTPGVLVRNHGPFTWGKDVKEAAYHAVVLETVAEMALKTFLLSPDARIQNYILEKHYERKHGPHAYYGQVK